jgi:hypothetical protein
VTIAPVLSSPAEIIEIFIAGRTDFFAKSRGYNRRLNFQPRLDLKETN